MRKSDISKFSIIAQLTLAYLLQVSILLFCHFLPARSIVLSFSFSLWCDFRFTSLVMPSLGLTGAYLGSSGFARLSALRYKSSKKLAHLPASRSLRPSRTSFFAPCRPRRLFRLSIFFFSIYLSRGGSFIISVKISVMNIIANSSSNKKRNGNKMWYERGTCVRAVQFAKWIWMIIVLLRVYLTKLNM